MMIGQGSPSALRWRLAFLSGLVFRMGQLALATQLVCTATALVAAEPTMRVRIAWGGGTERTWQGTVRLSAGTLSDPSALGVEADEPGSMWLTDGGLEIRARSTRAYDGVDLTVTAPSDAKLIVEMSARQSHSRIERVEIPLGDLLRDLQNSPLDDQGNRLLVRRAPGDSLRVRFAGDSLVFAPGETLGVELEPELISLPPGTAVHIKTQLLVARGGKSVWIDERDAKLADKGAPPMVLPLQVPLPREEGVYDLVIEASERGLLRISKTLAERRVQVVVVAPQTPPDPMAASASGWKVVQELDPTTSSWGDRMSQLPGMSVWRKGPLSSGHAQPYQHSLGIAVQVGPAPHGADVAWEAYPLSISRPGVPHILEIEYPSDIAQTIGISVMEPNAAGAVMPIGLDSGVDVPDDATTTAPRWLKHQLIFWPATKNPLVLITDRRTNSRIVFGKLRVLAGPTHLPRAAARGQRAAPANESRLIAGYLNRPLFPENFSATESLDSWSGRSLDDWQTFYEGGTRLVEYLNHFGHNGLLLSVLADGSTIYPSQRLEPTPRYDTGTFFDQGFDPVRKDVAELLFRLFDREDLKLIPTVQFAAPLPELEALLRQGGRDSIGVEWVGADGATWLQRNEPARGLAPYYNPLNPRVQQAMLNVIREIAPRYAAHPSFAGLAIELSAGGYAQLPGDEWGFDDDTVARFEHDTGIHVPGTGDNRFAERARYLMVAQHGAWVDWRAATLAEFHRRLQQEVAAARAGARLYLVPTNPLDTASAQRDLRPALPSRVKIDDVLRTVGLRTSLYRDLPDLVFVRPQHLMPSGMLSAQPMDLELNRASDLDRQLSALARPAAAFFHEPQKTRVASFDTKSPWGKAKTYTWLVSQISPSDDRNRQRFVHALTTLDPQMMFDGGWLLPLGQESSLVDLIASYRSLPDARFMTLEEETQPVTIRTLVQEGQTWAYFVNDSPWEATLRLRVDMPSGCRVDEISGLRRIAPLSGNVWTVELGAYDLLAVRFGAAPIRFWKPELQLHGNVETVLNQRIQDLSARAAALATPVPLSVLANASFEQPAKAGQIPGWTVSGVADVRPVAAGAPANPQAGPQSVQFTSKGAPVALRSDPFDPPRTGRLSVSVWLKVASVDKQPTLRLAVEGLLDGKEYYRFAPVGAGEDVKHISDQWSQYVLPLEDLPTEGLSQLRVRFDLTGQSEVWIDDVQLFDLAFSNNERIELTKIITLANIALQTGKVGDCVRVLDGYWPRFLMTNVPLTQLPVAQQQPAPQQQPPVAKPAEKPVEKSADKSGTWMKRIWPFN